jgi:hypothetical protein
MKMIFPRLPDIQLTRIHRLRCDWVMRDRARHHQPVLVSMEAILVCMYLDQTETCSISDFLSFNKRQEEFAFHLSKMATRVAFESSNEIGVFSALTNAYCLTGKRQNRGMNILWCPGMLCYCVFHVKRGYGVSKFSIFFCCLCLLHFADPILDFMLQELEDLRTSIPSLNRNFPITFQSFMLLFLVVGLLEERP